VLPESDKGKHFVTLYNSSVKCFLNQQTVHVPIVDFKSAPQVQIVKVNTNKYEPQSSFFVHKAAVKASLLLAQQVADKKITLEESCESKRVSELIEEITHEYNARTTPKNPKYNLSQYSCRPFPILSYDPHLQLAVLSIDLDLFHEPVGTEEAYATSKAAQAAAAASATEGASPSQEEQQDPLFVGTVKLFLSVDYLASVVYRTDFKWSKIHPFQDRVNSDLYVIARKEEAKSEVECYDIEFLHDRISVQPCDLLCAPNVMVHDSVAKKRLSQGVACSVM
jgi:hypothetical protein